MDKIIGPDVIDRFRSARHRTGRETAFASSPSMQAQSLQLPETVNPLRVEGLDFLAQGFPSSTIPIAGMLLSQAMQALHKLEGSSSGPILPMRSTDPHQLTGAALGNVPVDQNADRLTPLWSAYHFFASNSFMASISRSRSATIFFKRVFSRSSCRRRWASLTFRPPYLLRQR